MERSGRDAALLRRHFLDRIDGAMEIGAGGVGEREDEAGLAQLRIVGERFARGRLRRRTDDRPSETFDRLLAVEVERFGHHQVDGPRTGLG